MKKIRNSCNVEIKVVIIHFFVGQKNPKNHKPISKSKGRFFMTRDFSKEILAMGDAEIDSHGRFTILKTVRETIGIKK